jgi:hypothetical protein
MAKTADPTNPTKLTLEDYVTIFYLDLLRTFLLAKDSFNKQDWPTLQDLLDPDVILNKVDDPVGNQSVVGKTDVMNYLVTEVAVDQPRFTPTTINVNRRTGIVSGTAMWLDHDTDQNGEIHTTNRPITYSFSFTLRKPNPNARRKWLIVNLYGSPD